MHSTTQFSEMIWRNDGIVVVYNYVYNIILMELVKLALLFVVHWIQREKQVKATDFKKNAEAEIFLFLFR